MAGALPSFIATPLPAPKASHRSKPAGALSTHRHAVRMVTAPKVSRRRLGELAVSASVAAVAAAVGGAPEARAQPPQRMAPSKRPVFITDESGVKYYDVKEGAGAPPSEGDFVVIDYLAFLSNGKIFDNRKGFVFQFGQRQVIPGLETAVGTMRPGGQRKIVVPPALAYGQKGVCVAGQDECLVPPGETLGYDVTLLRVAIPPT